MASRKQLKANRENAKKGGPRTAKGKIAVSRNALKHGLTGKDLCIDSKQVKEVEAFRESYYKDLCPVGAVEISLVDIIWSSAWRLNMIVKSQSDYLRSRLEHCRFDVEGKERPDCDIWEMVVRGEVNRGNPLATWQRYQTTYERQMLKFLHELERRQAARNGDKPPAPVAIDVNISSDDQTEESAMVNSPSILVSKRRAPESTVKLLPVGEK